MISKGSMDSLKSSGNISADVCSLSEEGHRTCRGRLLTIHNIKSGHFLNPQKRQANDQKSVIKMLG